jgi:hypothetical protein
MPAAAAQPTDLRSTMSRAHDQTDALLNDPKGNPLEIVVWMSAHIAAFEHAVYPIVRRQVPRGEMLVAADRKVAARIARTLRMLERRHSGDVLATRLSADRLAERLSALVAEHRRVLARILDGIEQSMDDDAMHALAVKYETALAHAPTRPHPHVRAGLMFRLDALRDRILDTMDGRHIPLPRAPRARITPGRWGAYLLGQQHARPDDARDPHATA